MRLTRPACTLLLLSAACLLNSSALAAPINSNLVLELDAAAANVTLPGPVGPNSLPRVSAWADTAALGGANNATQTTNAARPEYYATVPTLNGQPALRFFGSGTTPANDPDGSFDEMIIGGMGGNFPTASTLLIVGVPETIGSNSTTYNLYDTHSTDSYWNFTGASGYMGMWRSSRVDGTLPTGGAALSGSQIFELSVRSTAGAGIALTEYRYFENEIAKGSNTGANYSAGDTTHKLGNAQDTNSIKAYEGYVAEALVYNTALNNAERIISANYLSAKFNVGATVVSVVNNTLGANDHYQGDLSTLQNYDLDVFGIGQVDGTNLLSNSENNAGLQITGNGTLSDGDWVLAGHKTPVNSFTLDGRWARVWYVDKTTLNTVDATLTFDYSEAGLVAPSLGNNPWTIIGLLYSPTDPYSFSTVGVSYTATGDQISFFVPDAQLLDGYYTLLAVTVPEPSTFALLGLGAIGMAVKARRRRRLSA